MKPRRIQLSCDPSLPQVGQAHSARHTKQPRSNKTIIKLLNTYIGLPTKIQVLKRDKRSVSISRDIFEKRKSVFQV